MTRPGPARVVVRPVEFADAAAWRRMRLALWPDSAPSDVHRYFSGAAAEPQEVLVAELPSGELAGFAELSLRAYAEGCEGSPVAYLEGWYVDERGRGRGVGRALLAGVEAWGRAHGCSELGSDTEIGNEAGAAAHRACGFEEVATVRCFRKSIRASRA